MTSVVSVRIRSSVVPKLKLVVTNGKLNTTEVLSCMENCDMVCSTVEGVKLILKLLGMITISKAPGTASVSQLSGSVHVTPSPSPFHVTVAAFAMETENIERRKKKARKVYLVFFMVKLGCCVEIT